MSTDYNRFSEYYSLKDKLKPIICKACKDDGHYSGVCAKCLKNQAWNREWLETHTFRSDDELCNYHTHSHDNIKGLVLRLPNEHPYLYYGIELEVEFHGVDVIDYDEDGYDEGTSADMCEILRKFSEITDGLFVYEQDSSLSNGVELISRPCSYAYWTSEGTIDTLKKGLEYLKSQGAVVEQPSTNGMHIHISRKFFDSGETKLPNRRSAYADFDWLFQKFQPEFEKLGERKYTQYCESKADKLKRSLQRNYLGSTQYNVEAKINCKLKRGGEMASGDHSHAVLLSGNTIEVRTFKSTVDYRKVLANIELVRNIAHAVRDNHINTTLDELLHTKDNLFLDKHISETRMRCKKNKEEFNLDKVNDDEIDLSVDVISR